MQNNIPTVSISEIYCCIVKAPFTLRSIFGTAQIKLVPVPLFWFLVVQEPKSGTVPKIEHSVNGALGSPRTKKWYGTKN
jgi:hypothetical protein